MFLIAISITNKHKRYNTLYDDTVKAFKAARVEAQGGEDGGEDLLQ